MKNRDLFAFHRARRLLGTCNSIFIMKSDVHAERAAEKDRSERVRVRKYNFVSDCYIRSHKNEKYFVELLLYTFL